jgi:hypothetical protein
MVFVQCDIVPIIEIIPNVVGFQVITAACMKMAVFWVVAPCSVIEACRRFRGASCLHHLGDDSHLQHLTYLGFFYIYKIRNPSIKSHYFFLYLLQIEINGNSYNHI